MLADLGLFPYLPAADVNTPDTDGQIQVFIDTADDILKGKDSNGNVRNFSSNGDDVTLSPVAP